MKKHKRKIYLVVVLLLVIIGGIIGVKNYLFPYYKIESRTKQLKKFRTIDGEKAIGWIKVQGTDIDFPIVYYYDSDVSDATNELGWSFSNKKTLQKKTTIFSHNILNVSSNPLIRDKNHKRFEQLLSFIYTDFVKENKYIQYTVGKKDYLYKIYGVSFQKEKNLNYKNPNLSNKKMKEYIKYTKKNSYFDFNVDVDENDKLITLVTCTRFFGNTTDYSFVVDARLVRDKEIVKNYKVTEKKNYDKIKKIMEGEKDEA